MSIESASRPLPLPLPPSPEPEGPPHVYVLNSDPSFLEMIGELLADTRVRVSLEQMRPNVLVTVDNLRSARPDLLILDAVPYRDDAERLLDYLREDEELHELPVLLACTSAGIAERLAERFPDLVRDVLPKPFDLDEFFARLGRLLPSA
jgi:CheY-like chemotaxis protein